MTSDSPVQTPQEGRPLASPGHGSGSGSAVCLRHPKANKLRVAWRHSELHYALEETGWYETEAVALYGECSCGCGLPLPVAIVRDGGWNSGDLAATPLQKYADPENCRRALYALMHPTLDLSGMLPERAKQAARMAAEAVRAAKLGQARAVVDARAEVEHVALKPDPRSSNRVRLSDRHWQMLGELQALGYHQGNSYSALVAELIERAVEDGRARARQEGEHDA